MIQIEDVNEERIAERQVPSYLWKYWKPKLEEQGYSWQYFLSDISAMIPQIQRWVVGEVNWKEVIAEAKQNLGLETN